MKTCNELELLQRRRHPQQTLDGPLGHGVSGVFHDCKQLTSDLPVVLVTTAAANAGSAHKRKCREFIETKVGNMSFSGNLVCRSCSVRKSRAAQARRAAAIPPSATCKCSGCAITKGASEFHSARRPCMVMQALQKPVQCQLQPKASDQAGSQPTRNLYSTRKVSKQPSLYGPVSRSRGDNGSMYHPKLAPSSM